MLNIERIRSLKVARSLLSVGGVAVMVEVWFALHGGGSDGAEFGKVGGVAVGVSGGEALMV
jgi:hypothetical protein